MTALNTATVVPYPSAASAPVLELAGVHKSYGELEVLHGIDLGITAGELIAIVGPSGSGKSTLLQVMGTLDRPSSGVIRLAGQDVAELDDAALSAVRAYRIGFVFQQFHLVDGLTAVDNVADGLLYRGTPLGERRERAIAALTKVGLGQRLRHRAGQLSGGERQRTAIARAVVGDPMVVLADEPTGNLDTRTGQEILALLRELNDNGTTIVLITHDLDVAAMAGRKIEIRDGRIVSDSAAPAAQTNWRRGGHG